jgi:hypothetical protein
MAVQFDEHQMWETTGGVPVVNGYIYIGTQGLDPKLNPISIFSDRALTTPLANPVRTDSYGRAVSKIWLSGRYSVKLEDEDNNQLYQELDNGEAEGATVAALSNVAGTNAITAEASPTITSYVDKAQYIFQVLLENTADAVTLNIDSVGAKAIKRNFNQDVGIGRFKVGQTVIVAYNAANDNFELVNQNLSVLLMGNNSIATAATVNLAAALANSVTLTGHAGPITSLGTVLAGAIFKLTTSGSTPVAITSSSIASPTNILCAAVHGLTTGDTVLIEGHTGSVPNINGSHVVTVVDTTNYTIAVNVTTGGTGGTSTGVPLMTHNSTSLILLGGQSRVLSPGDTQEFVSLGSGNWREINYSPAAGTQPTGLVLPFIGLVAPPGWIISGGGTIGNPSSGGTQRANVDTEALFTLLWDSMADAQAPVSSGRGASAAADFAANKNITVPAMAGRVPVGTGGTAPAIHGDNGGSETVALVTAELAAHTHGSNAAGAAGGTTLTDNTGAFTVPNSGSATDSEGSGTAHENMMPWFSLAYIIKL